MSVELLMAVCVLDLCFTIVCGFCIAVIYKNLQYTSDMIIKTLEAFVSEDK